MSTPSGKSISAPQPAEGVRQRGWQPANPLETAPAHAVHRPHGTLPNTPLAVATIAFILGTVFTLGSLWCGIGGVQGWPSYRLGFFVAAWSFFHYAEFAVTAGWNRDKVSVDSFLLNNGPQYHIAHSVAMTEFLLTSWFFPQFKTWPYVTPIGMVVTLVSQALRSGAMIQASISFSHSVMFTKLDQHVLVTDGVYGWLRHPSYAGFFYWGLGTQLVLQNPISFVAYAIAMWKFFAYRIPVEEKQLIKFFGDDYVNYRKRVGTWIPFLA